MKKYLLLLLALVCLLSLAGCGCEHQWLDATGGHGQVCDLCGQTQNADEPCSYADGGIADCKNPPICIICGKPKVEAKDHAWKDATCYDPKICADCGAMEGQPAGHSYPDVPLDCENPAACTVCGELRQEAKAHNWKEATCVDPKLCLACGQQRQETKPHDWKEATCAEPKSCLVCGRQEGETKPHTWLDATVNAPKTCSVCGETEGEPLDAKSLFDAQVCQPLFGSWEGEFVMTGEMMGDPSLPEIRVILGITFHDDGTWSESVRLADEEAFQKVLTEYYIQVLYAEFEGYGMTKEEADQTMMEAYGKTVAEYAAALAQIIDINAALGLSAVTGVYFVADGQLYFGQTWEEMEAEPLLLEDGKLTLSVGDLSEAIILTRVE